MNLRQPGKWAFPLFALSLLLAAAPADGQTAQDIADSVVNNLDNVTSYTATVDTTYPDGQNSQVGGSLSWKRTSGTLKVKMVLGSPYVALFKSDGTGWNVSDRNWPGEVWWVGQSSGRDGLREAYGADMFNMEDILRAETWSRDVNTATVNGVTCYRLYTSKTSNNYEVWVDQSTQTKVIRVKATDANNILQWQFDYSNYSNVGGVSHMAATVVTTRYINGSADLVSTHTFSNVAVNGAIADSVFSVRSE